MKTQYNIKNQSQKHIIQYLAKFEDTNNPGFLVFKVPQDGELQDILLNSSSLIEHLLKKLTDLDHEKLNKELEKCFIKYLVVQKMEEKLQIDKETKDSLIYKIECSSNVKLFKQKFDEIIQQHESALSLPGVEHHVQNVINHKLTNEVLQPILNGERFFKAMDVQPKEQQSFRQAVPKPEVSKLMPFISDSNLEVTNAYNETLMFVAARRGQPQVLDALLIKQQHNVNKVNPKGKTAFHHAVEGQDQTLAMQCCTLLINAGVDRNTKDIAKKTAYDYAKSEEMRLFLETNGVKPGDEVADGEFAPAPMGEIAPAFTLDWQ